MLKQLIEALLGRKIRLKRKGREWVVIDLDAGTIRLPDGTLIRKDDIISIDTANKIIVIRDPVTNKIREVKYA